MCCGSNTMLATASHQPLAATSPVEQLEPVGEQHDLALLPPLRHVSGVTAAASARCLSGASTLAAHTVSAGTRRETNTRHRATQPAATVNRGGPPAPHVGHPADHAAEQEAGGSRAGAHAHICAPVLQRL